LAGENWEGDQLKTPDGSWDLAVVAREEGGKFLPFWIQTMIDDPPTGATGVASEFLGFRQWPQPPKELRDELRDNLAAIFPLERLGQDQRNEMKRQGLDVKGSNKEAITAIKARNDKKLDKKKFVPVVDQAKTDYMEKLIGNPKLTDEYDEFNFKLRNKFERGLRIDWGDDVINEVEEYFLTSKDIPPLWRRWVRDREIIVEYWRVKDNYMLRTPRARAVEPALRRAINTRNEPQIERLSRHPLILEMDREVRKRRDALRERNPRLDAILFFWGIVGTTRTTRARRMAARMRL
jgi:hypothetical protein